MSAIETEKGEKERQGGEKPDVKEVEVHVDYIGADDKVRRKFPQTAVLAEVKQWAREQFVPNPPSDKAYYLVDDKTRHRFTEAEEQETLLALGYEHKADLRLTEEQIAGKG